MTLKMEAVHTSETLEPIYLTTWRNYLHVLSTIC
jgi:hypothetical protein